MKFSFTSIILMLAASAASSSTRSTRIWNLRFGRLHTPAGVLVNQHHWRQLVVPRQYRAAAVQLRHRRLVLFRLRTGACGLHLGDPLRRLSLREKPWICGLSERRPLLPARAWESVVPSRGGWLPRASKSRRSRAERLSSRNSDATSSGHR